MISLMQVAMNTSDMAGSLRFFSEVFGFRNAGAQALWGNAAAGQGLPPESRAIQWWLLGAQELFEIEFFHHTVPPQRPTPADWTPSDHGWVRFGIITDRFDSVLAALPTWGITLLADVENRTESRRCAFVEIFSHRVIEVIEATDATPCPSIAYVTSSVADLDKARIFWGETLALPIGPLDRLHTLKDEALWGLSGAPREGFVVDAGPALVEVVCYKAGRPASDIRPEDQGIPNVMLGSLDVGDVEPVLARIEATGLKRAHTLRGDGIIASSVIEAGHEIELAALPEAVLPMIGFKPHTPFLNEWVG